MPCSIQTYENRPTRAEISLKALENNLEIVKSMVGPGVKIMAMIKANAYGHGLLRIAREFLDMGAHSLGVAYLEEAMLLRQHGITAPIAVLGAINTDQIEDFIHHDIEITSSSIEKSTAISKTAVKLNKTAKVHLKIDTGMERIGVHWYNADRFINETFGMEKICIKGVFSHLAKAETDRKFTELQISRFNTVLEDMERKGLLPEIISLANSAGILFHKDSHFNCVRPGIMLYGYNPAGYLPDDTFNGRFLQPVMHLKTKVSFFKVCPENTGISYNHTYVTPAQTRIVTLPVGYGDGYRRNLSNSGHVIIRGQKYPVVGNICMDQTMVDISMDGTAYNGDDVLLFGKDQSGSIPLEELCDILDTIPYELVCGISPRVPRKYI